MTDDEKRQLLKARNDFLRLSKEWILPVVVPTEGEGPTMVGGQWYDSMEEALKAIKRD